MIRKSDMVRSLVAEHQYKKALRIAKDFRLGITAEQSLRMKKAYECMVHEFWMGQSQKKLCGYGCRIIPYW